MKRDRIECGTLRFNRESRSNRNRPNHLRADLRLNQRLMVRDVTYLARR